MVKGRSEREKKRTRGKCLAGVPRLFDLLTMNNSLHKFPDDQSHPASLVFSSVLPTSFAKVRGGLHILHEHAPGLASPVLNPPSKAQTALARAAHNYNACTMQHNS